MDSLQFGSRKVEITSRDKIYFPDSNLTKGDVIDYYRQIAEKMLPHLTDRPLTVFRYPNGIGEKGFVQQRAPDYYPDWIERVTVEKEGGEITHPVCSDEATLVYLANQGCITLHRWLSRTDRLYYPDRLVLDLDPSDDDFEGARRAAFVVRDVLLDLRMEPYVMTTGSTGLHVVVPLDRSADFDTVREFARDIAALVAARHPDEFTDEQRKGSRKGRVFIDVMRNTYAHTSVVPYSLRALPGALVATPIDWDELKERNVHAKRYTLKNIFRRLGRKKNPWHEMDRKVFSIETHRGQLNEKRERDGLV